MDAPLAVLNPGGRDKFRAFPQGAGTPGEAGHPPVNYHAYAACDRGAFCQVEREIPESARGVLVLLRKNGFEDALRAVHSQKKAGRKVFISLKESGSHQVAEALGDGKRLERFREICRAADGYIASGPYVSAVYEAGGCRGGEFLPTPYPIEEDAWDFSRPLADRAGGLAPLVRVVGEVEGERPGRPGRPACAANHAVNVASCRRPLRGPPVMDCNGRTARG